MIDEKLAPAEFERLFALSLSDYNSQIPTWLRSVDPIDVREGVDALLNQLKAANKKSKKLEGVLSSNGISIPIDIPYVVAKQKVIEIQQRIMGGDVDEKTYFQLCADLEKYSTAMTASDEYHEELRQKEREWEEQHRTENRDALIKLRRHMPVNIRFLSEDALIKQHKLPPKIARKFKRTDVLSLIRKAPENVAKMHPGILEGLKTGGLTLTERRALYEHLRTVGPKWLKAKDDMSQRKAQWYQNFKSKFKEQADAWAQHKKEFGSPATHKKCNKIGMQCPFKADAQLDYSGDFGFPKGDEYEQDTVTKAPKPFVKEDEQPKRAANPMAAAISARAASKPSFLGELSKKKSPASSSTPAKTSSGTTKPRTTSFTAMKAIPKKNATQKSVLKEIKKKTPEEIAQEKAAQAKKVAQAKYDAKRAARDDILETHYKKKSDDYLIDARAITQAMEDSMDDITALLEEWIDYVVRSGKKDLSEDAIEEEIWDFKDAVDPIGNVVEQYLERLGEVSPSTVECELAEDLYLCAVVFFNFIQWRMGELKQKDADLSKSIADVQSNLKKLVAKNGRKLKLFGIKAERTRDIPCAKKIMEEKTRLIKKQQEEQKAKAAAAKAPPKPAKKEAQPLSKYSDHKTRDSLSTSVHKRQSKPGTIERKMSFTTRTMEHQGKENLKWQLVHQVNDAQKMVRRLESAITAAGLTIPDDTIPYQEAEAKIAELSKRMAEISFQHPDYFTLEQEMTKYSAALMASDEYRRETERREREWEASVREKNREALKQIRRHMPVEVRKMTEAELAQKIPKAIARKFKRTNVLQLIRVNPNDVAKFHHSNFEGLSLSGMTLTERRALYEHLHAVGPQWFRQKSNEQIERKWLWFQSMKNKFREELRKSETLGAKYSAGQPDYSGNYGFPDGAVYEVMGHAKVDLSHSQKRAKELREQRKQGGR
ncbi:expressed unknown protein [Seminavis robusta]|uniref:Uncharacterized protein n=1 Tax=Seminavis robusta TaxID=568900 RepID=A0A9N8D9F1_9STRA|nr:expressed unknown protein [Seminavis robusta]|eukprot:Sro47_g027640.1 n/a (939) ;mRNA; r:9657-12738